MTKSFSRTQLFGFRISDFFRISSTLRSSTARCPPLESFGTDFSSSVCLFSHATEDGSFDTRHLIGPLDFPAAVGKGKQMRVGLDVNNTVGDNSRPINRRTEVRLADDLLVFAGGHHRKITIFISGVE